MKKLSGNPYIIRKNGKIIIDSLTLDDLMEKYETPLMVFIENRIRDNIKSFNSIFNEIFDNFQSFYSMKANYLPEICKIVNSEGVGVKIVGVPEFKLALNLGFSPEKIIIGGPYLPEDLIKLSIQNKVKEIIVYNLKDLKIINSIAREHNWFQNICIRVNSQKYNSNLGVNLSANNIGILKKSIETYHNIKITSILSHFGTQMNNIAQFETNINSLVTSLNLLLKHNINVRNINLGGGFPEATVMPQNKLKEIAQTIKIILDRSGISYDTISFEPGRYFVGDSGMFITKIVKVNEDRWIFLNIGNHICPKFARCSLRFYNASQINEPHKYKTSIAGIIPTDQDVLAKNYFFTKNLIEQEIVLVANTGAYCLTFSNRFPYPLPKIILVKDENFIPIFDPILDKDFSLI
ncbi:MAG: alanine racemase [Candidatus Lokiarchaeota archaeon]|nr:alanine racemase [Candidatus Lokiarchaeota archaeon]